MSSTPIKTSRNAMPVGHQNQNEELLSRLQDPSAPLFLLGTLPPKKKQDSTSYSLSQCMESAAELVTTSRILAYDGFLIYGIDDKAAAGLDIEAAPTGQEEWENLPNNSQFMEPTQYANLISNMAQNYNCTGECIVTRNISKDDLSGKVDETLDNFGHANHGHPIQLLSDPQNASTTSPGDDSSSLVQALKNLSKKAYFRENLAPLSRYGGVAFAERHTLEYAKTSGKDYPTEHRHMMEQQKAGAEWFLTPPIYDPEPIQSLLKDYATACVANGLIPKKVILTFAPFSNPSTMESIQKYCGVTIPDRIQSRILSSTTTTNPEKEAADCLRDVFVGILESSQGLELPSLGIHCLQIDGQDGHVTRDLFLKLQDVLLSSRGTPWRMQWYDPAKTLSIMTEKSAEDLDAIRDARLWKTLVKAAFVGGGLVAFGVMLGATGDFFSFKVTVTGRDLALSNQIGDT